MQDKMTPSKRTELNKDKIQIDHIRDLITDEFNLPQNK